MLLIDRRTPTRGKNKGKMPKPFRTTYDEVLLALRAAYEFNARYRQYYKEVSAYSPEDEFGNLIPIRVPSTWAEVEVENGDWSWIGVALQFRFSEENLNAWRADGADVRFHVVVPEEAEHVSKRFFCCWYRRCELPVSHAVKQWWRSVCAEAEGEDENVEELWSAVSIDKDEITVRFLARYIVDNEVPLADVALEDTMDKEEDEGDTSKSCEQKLAAALAKLLSEECAVAAEACNDKLEDFAQDEQWLTIESVGVEGGGDGGANWEKLCTQELESKLSTLEENQEAAAKSDVSVRRADERSVMHKGRLVQGIPVTIMPHFWDGRPVDEGAYGLCLDAFVSVFNERGCG